MSGSSGLEGARASSAVDNDPFADADYLPDLERAPGPWRQLWRDLVAPAPVSIWASHVTVTRVRCYDQIRVYVTRGMLLGALALFLSFAPDSSWTTWVLLIPALFQVVSEIVVDLTLRRDERSAGGIVGAMAAITDSAHSFKLVNVTGLAGTLAVPANVVAAAYFTGPGEPSWAKLLALTAASGYGISAILSLLTDTTNYEPNQWNTLPYRVYRRVRPHLWLVVCLLMAVIVGGSVSLRRWNPVIEPLAWALCLLPLLIGTRQRDYERFLRASSEEIPNVQQAAKRTLSKDYHNTNTSIRTFARDIAQDKDVPPEIRAKAAALAPLISLMPEAIDEQQWAHQQRRPSLSGVAAKCASDVAVEAVVDLRLDDLSPTNYELARTLIAALVNNAGQAMQKVRREDRPLNDERIFVTGQVSAGQIHITVRDPLPLIDDWCNEGSTTMWLHRELIAHGGAGLSQGAVDDGNPLAGKEVHASWPVKRPPLRLRDLRP